MHAPGERRCMTRLVVGTDGTETSEKLVAYLQEVLDEDDAVYAMNSLPGGDRTSADDIAEGEEAIDVLEDGLADLVEFEREQFVRGNEPIEDLLAAADRHDADEYVIGIRKRTPVGKMVFGSTAQNLLLETDLPVRTVPVISD
jgi:nucleotide-binding universal stress UspA family protein